jgi:hypothetical protein
MINLISKFLKIVGGVSFNNKSMVYSTNNLDKTKIKINKYNKITGFLEKIKKICQCKAFPIVKVK